MVERHRSFEMQALMADSECRLDLTWASANAFVRAPKLARSDELSSLVADDLLKALELHTEPTT